MLRETWVLSRRQTQELLPDAQIYVERIVGLQESYSLYRPYRPMGSSFSNDPCGRTKPMESSHTSKW
jgi:hypothetical protein